MARRVVTASMESIFVQKPGVNGLTGYVACEETYFLLNLLYFRTEVQERRIGQIPGRRIILRQIQYETLIQYNREE